MLALRSRRALSASAPSIIAALGVLAVGGVAAWAAPTVTRIAVNSVGSGQIKSNAIISSKIAPKGVTRADIAPNAVIGSTIVDGSVGAADIATAAVGSDEIAAGAVTVAALAAGSVTAASLAPASVASVQIADGGVATADIAASAVTGVKIADGSITSGKLGAASVTADKIAPGVIGVLSLTNGQVTNAKLDADAVTTDKILNGTIGAADLAADSVGTSEIADDAVGSDEIDANAVTGPAIAAGAVTLGKLATGAVDSAAIVNGGIATADLANGSVTGDKIALGGEGQVLTTSSGSVVWANPKFPGQHTLYVEATGNAAQNGAGLVAANSYIDANAASEWVIVLEPGTYTLSAPLTLDLRTNLRGAGSSLTVINGNMSSAGGAALITTPNDDTGTRIEGVTIAPTGSAAAGIVGLAVPAPSLGPEEVVLRDVTVVTVENGAGVTTGMRWDAGSRVDAYDIEVRAFDGSAAAGIVVAGDVRASIDGLDATLGGAGALHVIELDGATAPTALGIDRANVDSGGGSIVHVTSTSASSTITFRYSELLGDLGADTASLLRRLRDTTINGVVDASDPDKISCSGVDKIDVDDQYAALDVDCQ